MPTVTRWFIKAGLLHLVIALTFNIWLALPPYALVLRPVQVHLFTVGWLTQLIFGVAYWMFPKFTKDNPRRDERVGWLVFITLNVGLWLRVAGESGMVWFDPQWGGLLVPAAICQFVAGWGFIWLIWGRVKER